MNIDKIKEKIKIERVNAMHALAIASLNENETSVAYARGWIGSLDTITVFIATEGEKR